MGSNESKYSEDGLGTKKRLVVSIKMVANLILNVSVLSVLSVFHFVPRSFGQRTDRQAEADRQTDRSTKRIRIRISHRLNRWVLLVLYKTTKSPRLRCYPKKEDQNDLKKEFSFHLSPFGPSETL